MAGLFTKMHAVGLHALVVAPEIVGLEKQEDPTAPLLADGGLLLRIGGLGQQQGRPWGTFRGDPHPALARFARLVEGRVFQQLKSEPLGKKANGLIVVGHQQGQGT